MLHLGLSWTLGNKKVALTPRKPLHLLHSSNRNLDWRSVTLEVWNFYVSVGGMTPALDMRPQLLTAR